MCKDKKLIWKSKKKKSRSCKTYEEQEEKPVFYSSVPLDKHKHDSHASRYEVISNAPPKPDIQTKVSRLYTIMNKHEICEQAMPIIEETQHRTTIAIGRIVTIYCS